MQQQYQILRPQYTVLPSPGQPTNKVTHGKIVSSTNPTINSAQQNVVGAHQMMNQQQQISQLTNQQLSVGQQQQQLQQQQQQQQQASVQATQQQPQPQFYVPKKVIENYSYCLPDIIGKGYSSKVYRGKNETTGETVAVKVIDMKGIKNEVQSFLLKNEINVLKKLNSNINCLKLLDVFHTANNTYIITEFCDHGDLKDLITKYGTFSERPAVRILKHLLNGLEEMQNKGVIHRDLKLANILVKDGIPKIADFGFSKDLNAEPCKIYYNVGTPMYMCPQSLTKNEYSFKSDIWSIGVLFYEMIYSVTPWTADTEQQLVEKMTTVPVQFPVNPSISEESKDFIRGCLTIDESKRFSLKDMFEHPLSQLFSKKEETPSNKQLSKQEIIPSNEQIKVSQDFNLGVATPVLPRQEQYFIQNNQVNVIPDRVEKYNAGYLGNQVVAGLTYVQDNKNKENITSHSPKSQNPIGLRSDLSPIPPKVKVMQEKAQEQYVGIIQKPVYTTDIPEKKYIINGTPKVGNKELMIPPTEKQEYPVQLYYQNQDKSPTINQKTVQQKQSFPTKQTPFAQQPSENEDPEFSQNDQIILAQVNFCRFLYRLQKLCDETSEFKTYGLKEKIKFFILKNIMIKINKLQQMSEQHINQFGMNDFLTYSQEESFQRFQVVIREYQAKYGSTFNLYWENIFYNNSKKELLQSDKKFSAVFDKTFIEFESFYIIAQGYLRTTIHELNQILDAKLKNIENRQEIPQEIQSTVVFLDYLITYYQLSQLMLEKFNQFDLFARVSKIEQIAEGKPVTLSKFHFSSIQNKIHQLEI